MKTKWQVLVNGATSVRLVLNIIFISSLDNFLLSLHENNTNVIMNMAQHRYLRQQLFYFKVLHEFVLQPNFLSQYLIMR